MLFVQNSSVLHSMNIELAYVLSNYWPVLYCNENIIQQIICSFLDLVFLFNTLPTYSKRSLSPSTLSPKFIFLNHTNYCKQFLKLNFFITAYYEVINMINQEFVVNVCKCFGRRLKRTSFATHLLLTNLPIKQIGSEKIHEHFFFIFVKGKNEGRINNGGFSMGCI